MARCFRAAFVGTRAVKADDGVRTRDLRFTKPLLYRLSYVGGIADVVELRHPREATQEAFLTPSWWSVSI
jgi:hypothetical protein